MGHTRVDAKRGGAMPTGLRLAEAGLALLALAAILGQWALAQQPPGIGPPQTVSPLQGRVDQAPPALYRQDWVPAQSEMGPGEPRSGWRRVVDSGTLLAGPVNPTVARPPRFYKDVPVDLFNRAVELFAVDLRVPSKGFDFILARVYSSRANFDQGSGGLAANWDYTYNRHLVIQGNGDAAVADGLGREDTFTGPGPTFTAPTGVFDTLVRNGDDTFTQTNCAGMEFHYNTAGWLASMVDRAGNTLTVNRDANQRITTVRDTNGRDYSFAHDGAGRLQSVTDFAGRQVVYVRDANSDLIRVRSPIVTGTPNDQDFTNGKTQLYTYSSGFADARLNHNLLAAVEPLYNVDNDPSLSKQWLSVTYSAVTQPHRPEFDQVETVRLGHDQGGPPEAPNTVVGGTYTFSRRPRTGGVHARTRIVDANGNRVEVAFDAAHNLIECVEFTNREVRPGEGDYTTRYVYAVEGLLTVITRPRGNRVLYAWDELNPQRRSQGNLLEWRRQAGGVEASGPPDLVTRWTFDPVWNQRRTQTDPRAFPLGIVPLDPFGHLNLQNPSVARYTTTNLFDYQEGTGFQTARGVPATEQIPEGLGDQNGDGATNQTEGNVVRVNFPTIQTAGPNLGQTASELRRFNADGQPVSITDPESRVTSYEYFVSNGTPGDASDREGYLKKIIRASGVLNLTDEWGYDTAGNVTSHIDPKGQQEDWTVNQLNQVVRGLSRVAFGTTRYQTDYIWNANDDLVEVRGENRDETGALYSYSTFTHKTEWNILHARIADDREKTRNDGTEQGWCRTEYFYDGNLNHTATRLPEAANGNQPSNIFTTRYDERDLVFKRIAGDSDTDPFTIPASSTVLTLNWDPNRNLLEQIDEIRQAVNPGAPTTSFPGSAGGDVTLHGYDGWDRRKSTTDGEANLHETAFDAASHVILQQLTGPIDHTVGATVRTLILRTLVVDERNRTVSTSDAHFDTATGLAIGDGSAVTTYTYDKSSLVTVATDDRGLSTTSQWDAAARRFKAIDHLLNEVEWGYDANSNVLTATRRGRRTDQGSPKDTYALTNTFDGVDRKVKEVDPAGDVNEWFFDSRSNVVKTSDAVRGAGHPTGPGNIIKHEHDGMNRRWKTERLLTANGRGDGAPAGSIITLQTWDCDSRLVSQTDANGHTTSYEWDEQNRKKKNILANGLFKQIFWNIDNQVAEWTDENQTSCQQTFNGLNLLLDRIVAPGPGVIGSNSESYGYDGARRPTKLDSPDGINPGVRALRLKWDSLSNLTQEDQAGKLVDSVFDGVGNRTSCTYPGEVGGPGRRALTATFDNLNRLQSLTSANPAGPVATWHYKGPNRVERRNYGPDATPVATLNASYDAMPRVIVLDHTGTQGQVAKFEYGHDRGHHRLYEKRVHDGNVGDVYSYESIYRVNTNLQSVDLSAVPPGTEIDPANFSSPDSLDYNWDGVQNRTTVVKTVGGTPTTTTYSAGPGDLEVNQYTQTQEGGNPAVNYTYDSNGNMTSDGTYNYAYDFRNRLVRVTLVAGGATVAEYGWDVFDRRTQKKAYIPGPPSTTSYYYDVLECIEDRDGADVPVRQYAWGPELDNLLQEIAQTATYWAHENAIGSIVALSDSATGTPVERYRYDPFGNTTVSLDGMTGNEYRFHGARFDPETGLYWMRARHYSPTLGRFLQRDPIGVWTDEVNLGNGLAFVGNDAPNHRDPLGLGFWDWFKKLIKKAEKLAEKAEAKLAEMDAKVAELTAARDAAEAEAVRTCALDRVAWYTVGRHQATTEEAIANNAAAGEAARVAQAARNASDVATSTLDDATKARDAFKDLLADFLRSIDEAKGK